MSQNAKTRQGQTGGSQEVLFAAGGGTVPSVARPLVLVTRGRIEFLARCPNCRNMHRHTHLGTVTGPCGTEYELQSRQAKGAA